MTWLVIALIFLSFTVIFTAIATSAILSVVSGRRASLPGFVMPAPALVLTPCLTPAGHPSSKEQAAPLLLAMAAHDARTPLASIQSSADLLKMRPLTPNDRRYLDNIQTASGHLSRLVAELTDLAALESGRLKLVKTPVNVKELVDRAIAGMAPIAQRHGVRLAVEGLADERVLGDRFRLEQVFWNLLGNAIKFTPSGGCVIVGASVYGRRLRLTVSDGGPGLSPGERRQLFEPFHRSPAGRRSGTRGWGLGLFISRKIVEAHRGAIGVEAAKLNRGSAFWFQLPLAVFLAWIFVVSGRPAVAQIPSSDEWACYERTVEERVEKLSARIIGPDRVRAIVRALPAVRVEGMPRLSVVLVLDTGVDDDQDKELQALLTEVLSLSPAQGDLLRTVRTRFIKPKRLSWLSVAGGLAVLFGFMIMGVFFSRLIRILERASTPPPQAPALPFAPVQSVMDKKTNTEDAETRLRLEQASSLAEMFAREDSVYVSLAAACLDPLEREVFVKALSPELQAQVMLYLSKSRYVDPETMDQLRTEIRRMMSGMVGGQAWSVQGGRE